MGPTCPNCLKPYTWGKSDLSEEAFAPRALFCASCQSLFFVDLDEIKRIQDAFRNQREDPSAPYRSKLAAFSQMFEKLFADAQRRHSENLASRPTSRAADSAPPIPVRDYLVPSLHRVFIQKGPFAGHTGVIAVLDDRDAIVRVDDHDEYTRVSLESIGRV